MKAEKETLKQKLQIIDENINYLENNKPEISGDDYGELQAVKHCLFEIAEASIDMASHIVAAEGFEKPESYAEMFPVLSKNDILDDELAEKLSEMARFRNLLVHRYGDIDEQKLENFIKQDLKDVKKFSQSIYTYIEE